MMSWTSVEHKEHFEECPSSPGVTHVAMLVCLVFKKYN